MDSQKPVIELSRCVRSVSRRVLTPTGAIVGLVLRIWLDGACKEETRCKQAAGRAQGKKAAEAKAGKASSESEHNSQGAVTSK